MYSSKINDGQILKKIEVVSNGKYYSYSINSMNNLLRCLIYAS